ncbi:MAG: twin-arginine translocation signal domain-containing protein [Chloroflexi bacterium]|nr:MAG: twin-arginine translocation signal domain-containing protein [Chloroflexota bacterium]
MPLSRRRFVKTAAGAVAGLGVIAVVPAWLLRSRDSGNTVRNSSGAAGAQDPVVVYIRDAAKGEVVLMSGTQEVVRTDRVLVRHLIDCCREA